MKILFLTLFIFVGLMPSRGLLADDSAADVLLKGVGAPNAPSEAGTPVVPYTPETVQVPAIEFKLTDPFLAKFFAAWQSSPHLPYDVNAWAMRVLKGDYSHAAH